MTSFENATVNHYDDVIVGSSGDNVINGGGGVDWLVANGGNDRFVFDDHFVGQITQKSTIADFSHDKIDLHLMDANITIAGDQAFLIVNDFTGNTAGEMTIDYFGNGCIIYLSTNTDNIVDGIIYVNDATAARAQVQSDFIL